jgi:starch synthase
MSKKKVLLITPELNPYTELTIISDLVRKMPSVGSDQFEFRILMPKFGIINERRHRLHEVVRLSGMNIIVDDEDYPLIIKVASLPGARLQVYFLDNEEFFKRKFIFHNENGEPFEDNQERIVFFCKGVMETVKKFGWPPDIIHLHGEMTSLIPLYMKTAYKNDPVFQSAKVVYSLYENQISHTFSQKFLDIAAINDLSFDDLQPFMDEDRINLDLGAVKFSDAIIAGSESTSEFVSSYGQGLSLHTLPYEADIDVAAHAQAEFYKNLLA